LAVHQALVDYEKKWIIQVIESLVISNFYRIGKSLE